jgi:hypothetical protein
VTAERQDNETNEPTGESRSFARTALARTVLIAAGLLVMLLAIGYHLSITAWLWLPVVFPAFWQEERRFSMRLLMLFTALEAIALAWFMHAEGRPF